MNGENTGFLVAICCFSLCLSHTCTHARTHTDTHRHTCTHTHTHVRIYRNTLGTWKKTTLSCRMMLLFGRCHTFISHGHVEYETLCTCVFLCPVLYFTSFTIKRMTLTLVFGSSDMYRYVRICT